MKPIASLIVAGSLSLALISPVAAHDWKESLLPLPAVPHTTLDSSLAAITAGVSIDFGVPEIVQGKDLAPGTNMKVSGVVSQIRSGMTIVKTPWGQRTLTLSNGKIDTKVGDAIILSVDLNNEIVEYERASEAKPIANIQWHNVADMKSLTDNA
jgi:hypothetical protein